MTLHPILLPVHPTGEPKTALKIAAKQSLLVANTGIDLDTYGGKIRIEWEPQAPVTPMGQLPFFTSFLKTSSLFSEWVRGCPMTWASPNAPKKRDVLGTILLSVLAGHTRYSHIATIRSDHVNPPLLGMEKVASVDSIRKSLMKLDPEESDLWMRENQTKLYLPLLYEPWILDTDASVKTVYGHQEGAVVGYNPHKPGRPSHTYHTYFIANLRVVLDVEVQEGNKIAASHTRPRLMKFLDSLPIEARPEFIRGDCAWGNEGAMTDLEQRGIPYLFKVRQTTGVKRLIERLFRQEKWVCAGQGWEGCESTLQLTGWKKKRRVVVLRRQIKEKKKKDVKAIKGSDQIVLFESKEQTWEYAVLTTTLSDAILTIAQHYRDRADSENNFDELKNQWGWCGFTTQDFKRCQLMARIIALIYNWWSLFVRLAIPEKHTEAITSRPLLLEAVGKQTTHGRQTTVTITSTHAKAHKAKQILTALAGFLKEINQNAQQLGWQELWNRILSRIFRWFLKNRPLRVPHLLPLPT